MKNTKALILFLWKLFRKCQGAGFLFLNSWFFPLHYKDDFSSSFIQFNLESGSLSLCLWAYLYFFFSQVPFVSLSHPCGSCEILLCSLSLCFPSHVFVYSLSVWFFFFPVCDLPMCLTPSLSLCLTYLFLCSSPCVSSLSPQPVSSCLLHVSLNVPGYAPFPRSEGFLQL